MLCAVLSKSNVDNFIRNSFANSNNLSIFDLSKTKTMKTSLVNQLVANFKRTLNPSSKWFAQDVADFKANVSRLSVKELEQKLGRFNAMNDEKSTFNKAVKKEVRLMDKSGLFNVSNMKPANCMD